MPANTRSTLALALVLASATGFLPTRARADAGGPGPAPGTTLGKDNCKSAEGLLPPEILAHYCKGEYENPVVEWKGFTFAPDFAASTEKNAGRFDLDAEGGIIEKATGKQPPRIYGFPFPKIDPSDPKAAAKVVWNYFYMTLSYGNLHAQSQVNWVGAGALERRSDQDVHFFYYDGQPEKRSIENPQNFLSQGLIETAAPADLNGTSALAWRYRDSNKRDQAWAYVPALRRARSVSPSNRSDGFLGSDMSQDDGPFFDGKPEDFNWTFKGEVDGLRFVDAENLKGKFNAKWQDTGGWRFFWPEGKELGYDDPAWKGVAWAPIGSAVAKRKFYVVEGVPKDRYYLFGKLELWLDKESFQGAWNRKFDWKGELLNTMQVIAYNLNKATRPDGSEDYIQGSNLSFQCAENVKMNRATVAGRKWSPTSALDVMVTYDPKDFTVEALARAGK